MMIVVKLSFVRGWGSDPSLLVLASFGLHDNVNVAEVLVHLCS